ncbi:MAG: NapC/NirT family cytochrome c [Acetobacteraceae bacterium]|nr:NapC/NirT family cytochrome c [Acetobacteraceae bacterium]
MTIQPPPQGSKGGLWRALRRPSAKYSLLTILAGFFSGIIFWGGFNTGMEATNTLDFCISCHEMRNTVYQEYRQIIHFTNRSGVRAVCSDCHVPKDWTHKLIRKVQASGELYGKLMGTISTPEKFEAKRLTLARREWARMKGADSRECRNCHSRDRCLCARRRRRRCRRNRDTRLEQGSREDHHRVLPGRFAHRVDHQGHRARWREEVAQGRDLRRMPRGRNGRHGQEDGHGPEDRAPADQGQGRFDPGHGAGGPRRQQSLPALHLEAPGGRRREDGQGQRDQARRDARGQQDGARQPLGLLGGLPPGYAHHARRQGRQPDQVYGRR